LRLDRWRLLVAQTDFARDVIDQQQDKDMPQEFLKSAASQGAQNVWWSSADLL
jgi:hypothetical protein